MLDLKSSTIPLIAALLVLTGLTHPAASAMPTRDKIGLERIENDLLVFNAPQGMDAPKSMKTGLFDLKHLGTLHPDEGGDPYFILTAKPCATCSEEKAIYAIRPDGTKPTSFVYPGRIQDSKSRATVLESRAFFGKCLPRRGDVLVIFQKEKVDRRPRPQLSVLVAEAGREHFDESLIVRRPPSIQLAVSAVKRKACQEIEGRNRMTQKQNILLQASDQMGTDEEEESEGTD